MPTGCGVRSHAHSQVQHIALVLVFLLVLQKPAPSVARFAVWNPSVSPRGTLESTGKAGIAVDLMQFHHVDSPYASLNLTLANRVEIAVKSSQERAQLFHNQIHSTNIAGKSAFTSSVFSTQGSYVMHLRLGTPARNFAVIADTGSDLVWVQCSPCTECFSQPDAVFNPTASSTYNTLPCTNNALCSALPKIATPCSSSNTCLYKYGYGDQSSTQGDLVSDTATLISTSGSSQTFGGIGFGCGHKNQGIFRSADGLVGLGQGPLSLVSQLGSQIGNVFSYCLVDFYSATSKTSSLLLGGTGGGAMGYTPLISNTVRPGFYYVNVLGITVGGTALKYPSGAFAIDQTGEGGLILDSGTTITQMDSRAYNPFLSVLSSLISYPLVDGSLLGFDLCYDLSSVSSPEIPSVVFQFQNLNVALPANNIFLQMDNEGTYCLAFQSSDLGLSIFGNVQQQNFRVAYDRANKRVGFAPMTC